MGAKKPNSGVVRLLDTRMEVGDIGNSAIPHLLSKSLQLASMLKTAFLNLDIKVI